MEKDMILSNTQLFRGIDEQEIPSLFQCLGASKSEYKKGEVILAEGTVTQNVGIILSGQAIISHNDVWGNTSILGNAAPGDVIAEVYASIPGQPLLITVSAAEDTTVMFLNVGRILTVCTSACPFHTTLVHNLLTVCARKSLQLSQKILHTGSKTIRGRLMSYFSECARTAGSSLFTVPYNRQQLADYLNVERSALCNELSKMQKDGLIRYQRNQFQLLE